MIKVMKSLQKYSSAQLVDLINRGLACVEHVNGVNYVVPTISGGAVVTANFEVAGKVNGNTIATGDAGSATAWDLCANTPTYSSTFAHGTLGAKCLASATMRWDYDGHLGGTLTDHYGRAYVKPIVVGSGASFGVRFDVTGSAGNGSTGIFFSTSDGKVRLCKKDLVYVSSTTASYSTNWQRIEWHVINSETVGFMELKYFSSMDATSPDQTLSFSNQDTGTSTFRISFGHHSFSAPDEGYFDDIVAGAASYPGPAVVLATHRGRRRGGYAL